MDKPFIVRRNDGEYSTIQLPNGVVETVWFPEDETKTSVTVGRTYVGLASVAERHIRDWETAPKDCE